MQKRRPKLYLLVIFFFIIVLFFSGGDTGSFSSAPAINAVICNAMYKTKWEFVMYVIPKVTFQCIEILFLLSCPLQTISIICILQLSVHKMFCLQRHVECMFCLLLYYGYCCGVNDVQDQSMSREIQYTVITTSCVKASLTAD